MAPLAVIASGMVTALGFNAPATLAALRAGVSGVGATPWPDIETGEPLNGARVRLPHWWEGVGKLADLVAPAIHECLQTEVQDSITDIPLLIGIAGRNRPGRIEGLDENLLDEIYARLDLPRHKDSQLFPFDEAGCFQALLAAQNLLNHGNANYVVVAGVDSFLNSATLNGYMENRRLMTATNSNGFFPSEAGTAVLIGKYSAQHADALCIYGLGLQQETATIGSTAPQHAKGLTQAIRQALDNAGVSLKDIAYRITDLSGEHYKFKEALFAAVRVSSSETKTSLDLWHPIEYLGAIGAAVLPCLLAQSMHAAQKSYAPGSLAICHIGTDDGIRAAMVVGLNKRREGVTL
jgi:3-oxoacyl-[acyl-carrier-protein] synthase I